MQLSRICAQKKPNSQTFRTLSTPQNPHSPPIPPVRSQIHQFQRVLHPQIFAPRCSWGLDLGGEKPRISGCFYPKETPGWVLELPGGEFRRDGNPGVSGALVAGGSREVQAPVTPAILQGNRAGFRTFGGIFDPQKNHTRRVFHYLQVGGGDQSSVQPLLPGGGRLWERGKKIPNSRSEKRGRVG